MALRSLAARRTGCATPRAIPAGGGLILNSCPQCASLELTVTCTYSVVLVCHHDVKRLVYAASITHAAPLLGDKIAASVGRGQISAPCSYTTLLQADVGMSGSVKGKNHTRVTNTAPA